MKKLNIIASLTLLLSLIVACNKNKELTIIDPKKPSCSFKYSSWTSCSSGLQIRTFTSSPSDCSGTPPADSIQRTCVILSSVKIGNQTWTNTNLDVSNYRNGDPILQVQDPSEWSNLTTGAWCYYNNHTANGTTYGKLYNWFAVSDSRGLAPNGYHIPTDAEWTTLTTYLGGLSLSGGNMKETGILPAGHWQTPNTGATNTSGFTALPGGWRFSNGSFTSLGKYGYWWSSSESNFSFAWYRSLNYNNSNVTSYFDNEVFGFSVRCLRD